MVLALAEVTWQYLRTNQEWRRGRERVRLSPPQDRQRDRNEARYRQDRYDPGACRYLAQINPGGSGHPCEITRKSAFRTGLKSLVNVLLDVGGRIDTR